MKTHVENNLYVLLTNVKEHGSNYNHWQHELTALDLDATIKQASNKGFLTGIKSEVNAFGDISVAFSTPTVTAAGLDFLDEF